MNKLLFFLILLVFISCKNSDYISDLKTSVNLIKNEMLMDFNLKFEIPVYLEKNLRMFSTAMITLKIKLYNDKDVIISEENIQRLIKYDRWNEIYSMKDSFSINERSYIDYKSIEKNLYEFNNVSFILKDTNNLDNKMYMNYDFSLKSVDFVEPFKFIEFYIKTDNIQKKNNKKYFYVKTN